MSCRFYYIAECSMNNAITFISSKLTILNLWFKGVAKLVLGYMGTNPLRNLGTLQWYGVYSISKFLLPFGCFTQTEINEISSTLICNIDLA